MEKKVIINSSKDVEYVNTNLESVFINKKESLILSNLYEDKKAVSVADILGLLEYYYDTVEEWEKRYKDLEEDLKENYKPISPSEQFGVSERDFV